MSPISREPKFQRRHGSLQVALGPVLLVVMLLLSFVFGNAHAQGYGSDAQDGAPVSTDDGPHVFWQDSSTAIIFYYCDGNIVSEQHEALDSLRFNGLCHDTGFQYLLTAEPPRVALDHEDSVSRILAISDIHGDYEHLVEILTAAGVIDSSLRWTWDDGHLVIVGDVFDRGPAVTECLWLIHRLEHEANGSGGAVHYLLGNHELMVLRGDLRYVHDRYLQGIARRSFAYDDLFGPETELGRWLRTKPTLLRLGPVLFVHAGITPERLSEMKSISHINDLVREGLDYSTARLHFDKPISKLYGSLGPLWYRGYLYGIEERYPAATTAEIDSVLMLCDVDYIVVGHSEQDSLQLYHDGKVIAIDVDVESLGEQQALLWDDGAFYRLTGRGDRRVLISSPRQ